MTDKLAIYGAGGFAKEVVWLNESLSDRPPFSLVALLDDSQNRLETLKGLTVMSLAELLKHHSDASVVLAIGNSQTREKIAARCEAQNLRFATIVHSSVQKSESVIIGEGCIVSCGSLLTVDVEIGRHVAINTDCTIAHDVVIDDFATLSPGVHVSGNVKIGRGAFIGTGATIANGSPSNPIVIGNYCTVAAGACVTHSTEPRSLYAGVPAVFKKSYT